MTPRTPAGLMVIDGYGVDVRVDRGQLLVRDGVADERRTRRLSRIDREVRRLVVLADTGTVSLEAVRWCADVGIALVQVDRAGRVLLADAGKAPDDPRLRRAQALAAGTEVGTAVARSLLTAKLDGQAAVLGDVLGLADAGHAVSSMAGELAEAPLERCRELEAAAANLYFGAWCARVAPRWASRDTERVPAHWTVYATRRSPLNKGASPRNAAHPVNALLNYLYGLAEAECRLAALAVGLDPGLGVLHVDRKARDSLALDLLEPVRPAVDAWLLQLLERRVLRAGDFHEGRDGFCRVLSPLTHLLAGTLPLWRRTVAPVAESVAHMIAQSSPRSIPLRTPLTQANVRSTQARRRRQTVSNGKAPAVNATCRVCGVELAEKRRQLCPGCWPVERRQLATERAARAVAVAAARRSEGLDPTRTQETRDRQAAALSYRKREQIEWEGLHTGTCNDLDWKSIQPGLAGIALSALQSATGLSVSACSRIRAGHLRPHRRHWAVLSKVAGAQCP